MAYGFGDGFLQGFSQPLIQFLPLLGQRIADNRQQKAMLGLNSAYQSGDPGGIATGLSSYYGEKMGPVKALPGGTMPTAMERMNAIKPGMDPSLSGMFQNMSQTAINAQPINFNDAITQANAITMQAKQAGLPVIYLPDGPTRMQDGSIGFKTFRAHRADDPASVEEIKKNIVAMKQLAAENPGMAFNMDKKGNVSASTKENKAVNLTELKTAKELASVMRGQKSQQGIVGAFKEFIMGKDPKDPEAIKGYAETVKNLYPDQKFSEAQINAGYWSQMAQQELMDQQSANQSQIQEGRELSQESTQLSIESKKKGNPKAFKSKEKADAAAKATGGKIYQGEDGLWYLVTGGKRAP